jgi:hypothetical protein
MSIFGKVLAVLNVLAAAGFFVLAGMDYSKRQSWAYSVFLHDLAIQGIPLDQSEVDADGNPLYLKLGGQTQSTLFPTQPVVTQEAEIRRVQEEVQRQIQTESGDDLTQQLASYARVLLPLAETNAEREQLLALVLRKDRFEQAYRQATGARPMAPPARPFDRETFAAVLAALRNRPGGPLAQAFIDKMKPDPRKAFAQAFAEAVETQRQRLDLELSKLKDQFAQAFQEAAQGQRASADPNKPSVEVRADERRLAIARLLFSMIVVPAQGPAGQPAEPVPDLATNAAYKRFLTVVGLRTAIQTVDGQALVLQRIVADLKVERQRERNAFALNHQYLLDQLREHAALLEQENFLLQRQQKQLADQEEQVKKRQRDVKYYEAELARARDETAKRLQELRAMTQALYETRIQVRDALSLNQEYEKRIRKLEASR